MKNSIIKTLLNYSTSLTKVTNKRLKNAKSPEDKIDLISKQFEDIKKKVDDVVKKDESTESEGESVIKLEFDKLNKRLDVIEATDYTKSNFIMGLLKGDDSESSGKSSDESDDGSLINILSGILSGSTDVSDLLSGGLTVAKLIKYSLGALVSHPYILLGVLGIAATIYISNKISAKIEDTNKKIEDTARGFNGITRSDLEKLFLKHAGMTYEEYMNKVATASPEYKEKLLKKLDEIWEAIRKEAAQNIVNEVNNPDEVSEDVGDRTQDPSYISETYKSREDILDNTLWDKLKKLFVPNSDRLLSNTLSIMDLSALGSVNGLSVSASDAIRGIETDYTSLINETVSEEESSYIYESFDYTDPLGSIKKIAIEHARTDNKYGSDKFDTAAYTDAYKMLLAAFIYPIGRTELPSTGTGTGSIANLWDEFRDISFKNKSMPSYKDILTVYYTKKGLFGGVKYKFDSDRDHTSNMTISQQCELLGVKDTNSLIDEESNKKFYFLPKMIKYKNNGKDVDISIKQSDRILLNQIGIMRAKRIELGDYKEESFSTILEEQKLAVELRQAKKEASDLIGIAPNSMDNYALDPEVVEILNRHSGIEDTDKWSRDKWNEFAKVLQKFSLNEIYSILDYGNTNTDNYKELLKILEDSGSKNPGKAVKAILESLRKYISSEINYNKDDIIDSYYGPRTSEFITDEKFDDMMNNISNDSDLRKIYNEARRKGDINLYWEVYKGLGFEDKRNTSELRPQDVELIDRIFRYYSRLVLHDEENAETGSIDLDNAAATYFNLSGKAVPTEDISSNTNLFGIGTLDDLQKTLKWGDNDVVQFLSEISKKDLVTMDSDENGLPILKYIQAGIDNNSEIVKKALIEVFKSMGIEEDTISKLFESVAAISETEGVIAESQEALLNGQSNTIEAINSNVSTLDISHNVPIERYQ